MKYHVDEENRWLTQNEEVEKMLHEQWCFHDEIERVVDKPFEEVISALEDYADAGFLIRKDDLTPAHGFHYRFKVDAEREAMTEEEDDLYREARRNLHITHIAASAIIEREIAKMGEDALFDTEGLLRDRVSPSALAEGISTGVVDGDAIINTGQALALAVLAQEHLLSNEIRGIPYDEEKHEERSVDRWLARRGNP